MWLYRIEEPKKSYKALLLTVLGTILILISSCSNISIKSLSSNDQQKLQSIAVSKIGSREGQLYRRELQRLLHVGGRKKSLYQLGYTINFESSSTLSIQGVSSTLKKATMSVSFHLTRLSDGKEVLKDVISANATIGAVTSLYGQDRSDTNAQERLAILLAKRTVSKLQLYFLQKVP